MYLLQFNLVLLFSKPTGGKSCSVTELPTSVPLLGGEIVLSMNCSSGHHLLVLTNYRIIITLEEGFYSLPLGLVQEVKQQRSRDLVLLCKNAKTIR